VSGFRAAPTRGSDGPDARKALPLAADKTYDSTTTASLTSIGRLMGLVGGDTLALTQTAATFADPNAGSPMARDWPAVLCRMCDALRCDVAKLTHDIPRVRR
jgi:hypothetical protein